MHGWLDHQMDRTSILGDTIDYVKELTERIKVLEEEIGASPEDLDLLNTLKDSSSNSSEMMVRNSTKVRALLLASSRIRMHTLLLASY